MNADLKDRFDFRPLSVETRSLRAKGLRARLVARYTDRLEGRPLAHLPLIGSRSTTLQSGDARLIIEAHSLAHSTHSRGSSEIATYLPAASWSLTFPLTNS